MTIYVILTPKPPTLRGCFTDIDRAKRLVNSGVFINPVIVACEADTWPPIVNEDNNAADICFSKDNKRIIYVDERVVDNPRELPAVSVPDRMVTLPITSRAYQAFKYNQEYSDLLKAAERKFPLEE